MQTNFDLLKIPCRKLQVCECRKLHLTYGSLTMHFKRDEFIAYADNVSRLLDQLHKMPDNRTIPLPSNWEQVHSC